MSQLRMQVRRGNRATLPDLAEGELGYARDTKEFFIGTSGAENVQVSTVAEVVARIASHKTEPGAHEVEGITGAETPSGAQAKVDAHAAAVAAHEVEQIIGAEIPAGAQAKVDTHAAASPAHSVSQITDAVSTTYLAANYYDKTASDGRYMPQGMSPIVAAIIFGG